MKKLYILLTILISYSSFSQINAVDDTTTTPITSGFSNVTVLNILNNDILNGSIATTSSVTLSPVINGPLSIAADGFLSLAANTASGTYSISYQICENANLTNCDTAVTTIIVANPLDAVNDGPITVFSSTVIFDILLNVMTNDTMNGIPVTTANTDITPITIGPISVDSNGVLTLAPNTPSGTYTVTYQLCEINPATGLMVVPANCDSAIVTVNVFNVINAVNDTLFNVNGMFGNPNVGNVLTNDTINGSQTTVSGVNISVITPATSNNGTNVPSLNTSTGMISIPANTPAGTYTITYQICEISNPLNCDAATVTIPVNAAILDAKNDSFSVNLGLSGNPNIGNVLNSNGFGSDEINGLPLLLSQINLSIIISATPLFPGAPVPNINSTNGIVSVPAGTPAGTYLITYQICEILNPTNCDNANVNIIVSDSGLHALFLRH